MQALPPSVMASLARKLSPFFPERDHAVEIAETLAIWALTSDRSFSPGRPLQQRARNTRRWHSQVRVNGEALLIARSRRQGRHAMELLSLSRGPLAPKLAEAIDWIDASEAPPDTARLLTIPAYLTVTIWLPGEPDRLVLVSSPLDLPTPSIHNADPLLASIHRAMPERRRP